MARNERDLIFQFLFLCIIFGITLYLSGCGEESEDGGPTLKSPEVPIISNTELLKYHPEEYLTGEIKSAPLLSRDKHPHGWQRADCTKCHRSPSKEAPAVCTNCHGRNGVNNQPDTCDNCHKVSSIYGDPPSGQHRAHIAEGVKDTNCDECHPGKPESSDVHANGHLNIVFKAENGKYNENLGICQNIACHEDRQWPGEGCSLCHSPYPPNTGYHTQHLSQGEMSCPVCHEGNDHDDDKNSGRIEIGGVKYNSITGDCASDCHKPQRWRCTDCHDYPPADGNHSQTTHEFSCDECHSEHDHSYKAAIRPKDFSEVAVELKQGGEYRDYTNDGVANGLCSPASACHETRRWGSSCTACHEQPPETGIHVLHVKREDNTCQDCHQGNEHGPDRGSGVIDIGGVEYDFINGDCSSSCHRQRRWDCITCHGYPPKSGNHPKHQALKFGCEQCHSEHRHSTNGISVPDNSSPIQVNFASGGGFNSGNQLCSGIICHEPRTWGSSCTDCHNSPPNTGAHQTHLATGDISCQACHKGNQHDADNSSGSIEIGGVGYNFINGNCTSVCHPPRQWPACTDCHDYPPFSGNHLAHNQPTGRYFGYSQQPFASLEDRSIPCDECHADHRHSYKAAIASRDFSEVEVRLQGGVFNPSNKLCSVSCHSPQKWGASCGDCHGAPPDTGRHSIHLQKPGLNCDDCHKGYQHDLDISSGFIEVGDNIIYDRFTGDCASTCHEKEQWDCTSCHGYPPDTGHHTVHTQLSQFECRICHKDHEHTFKAATNPNDRRNVKVSFTILGDWDKSTNSCKNIGCHENKKW